MERQKAYYSIGEVSVMTELEPHVLRYWESEFSALRPKKNRAGNRAYRKKDIEMVEKIKFLLYREMYTIEGAKRKLKVLKELPLDDYKSLERLFSDKKLIDELKKTVDRLTEK